MTKYLSVTLLILIASCKQPTSNLDSNNDSIQSSQEETTASIEEKIDYDAIWEESSYKLESDLSENFDLISNYLKEFIPSGFSVISTAIGDANLDGLSDTILLLKNDEDIYEPNIFILLLRQEDGTSKLKIKGNGGDTVKIDEGRIFIIHHNNAGVEIDFYKFDKTKENWIYIENFTAGLSGNGEITKADSMSTLGQ